MNGALLHVTGQYVACFVFLLDKVDNNIQKVDTFHTIIHRRNLTPERLNSSTGQQDCVSHSAQIDTQTYRSSVILSLNSQKYLYAFGVILRKTKLKFDEQ